MLFSVATFKHLLLILTLLFTGFLMAGSNTVAFAQTNDIISWQNTVLIPDGGSSRLIKLANGTILAGTTTLISSSRTEIKIFKSTDNGRTWTYVTNVSDGNRKVDNANFFQLPSGEVLLSGRNLIDGVSYRISLWRSNTNGVSWTGPTTVDSNESPGGRTDRGLWEPFLYALPDGKLTILYANEKFATQGYNQVISQKISSDGGLTWGAEVHAVYKKNGRPGMPWVTRMSNGNYKLVYEACLITPNCGVYQKDSTDGKTWGKTLGTAIPNHNCGPSIASLSDGRLVVNSCANTISYSNNFGATWVSNTPAYMSGNWPAIYQLNPGEVMAISDQGSRIRFGTVLPQ